jgi:hypothetical protein
MFLGVSGKSLSLLNVPGRCTGWEKTWEPGQPDGIGQKPARWMFRQSWLQSVRPA